MNRIKITPFKNGDEKEIAEIEKICFAKPWSESTVQAEAQGLSTFFVARDGETPVGYVSFRSVLDEGYINNIAVKPEYRNRGIGSALLEEINKESRKLNLSFLTLEVRESNLSAIHLYQKKGYEKVGTRKDFYNSPRENAVLLTYFLKK